MRNFPCTLFWKKNYALFTGRFFVGEKMIPKLSKVFVGDFRDVSKNLGRLIQLKECLQRYPTGTLQKKKTRLGGLAEFSGNRPSTSARSTTWTKRDSFQRLHNLSMYHHHLPVTGSNSRLILHASASPVHKMKPYMSKSHEASKW